MLKLTVVEGKDQFQAEGDDTVVKELLTEWRARIDVVTAEAWERMDALTQQSQPQPKAGPTRLAPFGKPRDEPAARPDNS